MGHVSSAGRFAEKSCRQQGKKIMSKINRRFAVSTGLLANQGWSRGNSRDNS